MIFKNLTQNFSKLNLLSLRIKKIIKLLANPFLILYKKLWKTFILEYFFLNSLNKRRSIIDWAKDLDLNGFSKPGKPGVICVEGEQSNVQAYLTKLKSVNWQRLMVEKNQNVLFNL